MKKPQNEVLRLERDGEYVVCKSQGGASIMLPEAAADALARYFAEGKDVAFVVGQLYAPSGSAKLTKLRIVCRALDSQHW